MRNKTKKLKSIKSISAFTLVLLVILNSVFAEPGRTPVSGYGSSVLNLMTNTSEGQVTFFIEGEELVADLDVTVLTMRISDEGVMHITAESTLTFADGSTITTSDKIVAEPVSPVLYIVNESLTIISGTGAYAGASGHLSVNGEEQIDWINMLAYVTYEIRGVISR